MDYTIIPKWDNRRVSVADFHYNTPFQDRTSLYGVNARNFRFLE